MAQFVNELPHQGGLLVLPPDDFYAMPYSWGYYGADSFVVDLFRTRVLVPNAQSYTATSHEVLSAVQLVAESILRLDWHQVDVLSNALDTRLILVRRDIDMTYPGRSILPPDGLTTALSRAPNFNLLKSIGSLDLYGLARDNQNPDATSFVTIDTSSPDLRILGLLPSGSALVTAEPQPGVTSAIQAPALDAWQAKGHNLEWHTNPSSDSSLRVAELGSKSILSIAQPGAITLGASKITTSVGLTGTAELTASITARQVLSNGDFAEGQWGAVADCNNTQHREKTPFLGAQVITNGAPGGLPALRLSASEDIACESQSVAWSGGALVISLMTKSVNAGAPHICLWETGPERCASIPRVSSAGSWSAYHTSLSPDPGTTALRLFLYADSAFPGETTVVEYADVRIFEVPILPSLVVLSSAESSMVSPPRLVTSQSSFSAQWQGPHEGKHVLVDGMINGWIIPDGSAAYVPYYKPAATFQAAVWTSLVALFLIVLLSIVPPLLRRRVVSESGLHK
jgi:hypothetical protein